MGNAVFPDDRCNHRIKDQLVIFQAGGLELPVEFHGDGKAIRLFNRHVAVWK